MILSLRRSIRRHGMGHPDTPHRAKETVARNRRACHVLNHPKKISSSRSIFVLWHLQIGKKGDESVVGSLRFDSQTTSEMCLEWKCHNLLYVVPLYEHARTEIHPERLEWGGGAERGSEYPLPKRLRLTLKR